MSRLVAQSLPPLYRDPGDRWALVQADSLAFLPLLPDHSVDVVIADPPYGVSMDGNRKWDSGFLADPEGFQAFCTAWARELRRIVRPGGYVASFGAPRTVHRLVSGMEDAGLQIRDTLAWFYASGAPKSRRMEFGLGTALKPAYEPIVLARVPLALGLTTTANLEAHGTGALNIQACSLPAPEKERQRSPHGFWPANLVLSHQPTCDPDRGCDPGCVVPLIDRHAAASGRRPGAPAISRLFYSAKATPVEREAGLEELPKQVSEIFSSRPAARPRANHHPTVKSLALTRWLVRLLAPPGGLVLDPFTGSGSVGIGALLEGRQFLGLEREPDYVRIARARLTHWATHAVAQQESSA